jgi:DNA-binding NarL/FixJ family response regulator
VHIPTTHRRAPLPVRGSALDALRMALRVVLADDSYLAREAVGHVLADAPDIEIVAVCGDRDELLEAIDAERPDVVVTDIRMPPDDTAEGVEVAARLRHTHPQIGVVVLSQYLEAAYALDLLAAGSDGRAYLLKERIHDRDELAGAVRTTAAGGSVIDPKVVEVLVAARARAATSPLAGLTRREREILAEIAQGKSNPAIATTLGLSKRAVEKHINAIFVKLELPESENVSRRVKAALLFLAEGSDGAPVPPRAPARG